MTTGALTRGVDIKNLDVVINYDIPYPCADYVHRAGNISSFIFSS